MIYNNTEFYVQDNWKVNNRLTLDYGMRFTHQQPQYDQFLQMSNFFPDQWSPSAGAAALRAGLQQRRDASARATRCNAMDPRTGQILTAPGAANTRRRSARSSRASGDLTNGIRQAGDGIAKYVATCGRSWSSDRASARRTT